MNQANVALTFDVEEHYRIEAAAGIDCPPALRQEYSRRMEGSTFRLLELLDQYKAKATFFVVGEIAISHPHLVREIAHRGHELASHSWAHRSVLRHTPASLKEDLLQSKDALEQASGTKVVGFRAPTFSIVRETAWAIKVLAECGFEYDSSIFPVRHDRYGIPDAPRLPFFAKFGSIKLLELPPLTLQQFRFNLPVAGGGYFRLIPLQFMQAGIRQMAQLPHSLSMLYFHPWEFDPEQPRLPLKRLSRWRTYVGMHGTINRLTRLLRDYRFVRAGDFAATINHAGLPQFEF